MATWKMFRPDVPHPFSMSASNGEWVLVSGVGGHHPDGSISDDLQTQVRDALGALSSLLEQAGSSWEEIVWFKPFVTRREHAPIMDDILREFLGEVPPAGGALTICELADPRMFVEFEAWAHKGATKEFS